MSTHAKLKTVLGRAVVVSNLGAKIWCGQTYEEVFTGETLVNELLKDPIEYTSRETALERAQELLDSRIITCITKRRVFDDGERLYCVNKKALENTDNLPIAEHAQRNSTKVSSTEKGLCRQNSHEMLKGLRNGAHIVSETSSCQSNGTRVFSNVLRLSGKDASVRNVRAIPSAGTRTASSEKASVKKGRDSFDVVLKDKQIEAVNDESSEKMEINQINVNPQEKVGEQKINAELLEAPSGRLETNGHLTVSVVENNTGNAGQSDTTLESETSYTGKRSGVDTQESAAASGKQKVCKTLSPALTALLEKDARNCQTYSRKEDKQDSKGGQNKEDPGGSAAENTVPDNKEVSNSWDPFQAKIQNKVKRAISGSSRDEDPRGARERTHASKQEESSNVLFGRVSRNVVGKEKLIQQSFYEKKARTSDVNSQRLTIENNSVSMPLALAQRKNPYLDGGQANEAKEKMVDSKPTTVSKNGRSKDKLNSKLTVKNETVLIPSLMGRKSSFLGDEESKEDAVEKSSATAKKVAGDGDRDSSSSSNIQPPYVVIEDSDSVKNYVGKKAFNSRERVPSVRNGSATVVVEEVNDEKISGPNKKLIVHKDESATKSTTLSFGSVVDSNTVVVAKVSSDIKQRSAETRYPVQRRENQSDLSPSDSFLDSTGQDDLVRVGGHAIPKTLAALLAKDGDIPRKNDEASKNSDMKLYRSKLKELKKTGSLDPDMPTVGTSSRSKDQSSDDEKPQDESLSENLGGRNKADLVKTEKSKFRVDLEGKGRGTTPGSKGQGEPDLAGLVSRSPEEESMSPVKLSERSKTITQHERRPDVSEGTRHGRTEGPVPPVGSEKIPKVSSGHTVPRLNLCSGTSFNQENVSSVSSRPSSLIVSPVSTSSASPSDNISPSLLQKELDRSRRDLQENKQQYENKITELQLQIDFLRRQNSGQIEVDGQISLESSAWMSDLTSLYSSFSTPVGSPANSNVASPVLTPSVTPRGSLASESPSVSSRSPPPPPPPAPPSVPSVPTSNGSHVKPTKPVVNPRINMKPLFWNRIINLDDSPRKGRSVWESIKEPAIDTTEFERLFSKKTADRKLKRTKSLRDDKHFAHIYGKRVVKLLETNRSRAIGIKMSSLTCQLEDIRTAVYNMDTSVVDMESLQSIYDIYPKEEEIMLIQQHFEKQPSVALDKPEEFMHQLTKMKHFKERLECWLFQDKFWEVIHGIDRSLSCVTEGCSTIVSNCEIAALLALILAYGNYMNGNTLRGQADGFHLDVLLKLRDVKAKDFDMNLLQYTVKQYLKQHERNAEKNKSESRLPSSVSLSNAAQISFDKLKEELLQVSQLLKETEAQVGKILEECPPAQRNPFEERMRKFQTSAKQSLSEENGKMKKAEAIFQETVEYFQWESEGKKATPQDFFTLWARFIEDVKNCMKVEKQQQHLAKKNFSKVEHLNQIRETATKFRKRRQSVDVII